MKTNVKELVVQGEARIARARSVLTPEQIRLAEWLSVPAKQRAPHNLTELGKELGVCGATLTAWKQIPEVWIVRDDCLGNKGKELVVEAIQILKDSLSCDNAKVRFEAAKDILDRWSEPRKHGTIAASIKDMYAKYQPDIEAPPAVEGTYTEVKEIKEPKPLDPALEQWYQGIENELAILKVEEAEAHIR